MQAQGKFDPEAESSKSLGGRRLLRAPPGGQGEAPQEGLAGFSGCGLSLERVLAGQRLPGVLMPLALGRAQEYDFAPDSET